MTSSETRLHSGEGMVGFEMVGLLTWLSKTLERKGRIDIGSYSYKLMFHAVGPVWD